MKEVELVQRAKQGDVSAMQQLYEGNFKSLWKFVKFRVDKDEITEDIVAEAFTRAFESIARFKHKSSFKTYVYTIAKNLVIEFYKQRDKKTVYRDEISRFEDNESQYRVLNQPIENLSSKEECSNEHTKEVKEILSKLKEKERLVLELRYLSNFSVKQTAEVLKISESNVKVITHRAIKNCKLLITND